MNDLISKVTAWIKANVLLAVLVACVAIFILFGRQVKRMLFGVRRVRHRRPVVRRVARRRRSLPRSVGMHKMKPAYHRSGKVKKPWQVKGSQAARRHMAKIRRMR